MKSQSRKISRYYIILLLPFLLVINDTVAFSQDDSIKPKHSLSNPISTEYLSNHIEKQSPRLVLNSEIEKQLRTKLKSDPVVQNMYEALVLNANEIMEEPLLEREVIGRRLLSTSRELLYRMNILGMVYRVDKDPDVLNRINEELIAVCTFEDWNPSHFLDVAEMAMGVAIAVDWAGSDLPESTVELGHTCLIEKGINPSFDEDVYNGWVTGHTNWNQVCNAGMVAAAIAIADTDPELAAKTISRSLEGIPYALDSYGPDGVYAEGPTYWDYGTTFSALTSSMLESAFGTDFGLSDYPAFMESADFRLLTIAPSGWYYNFGDSGDRRSENGNLTLAWFAAKSGNSNYFERERFLRDPHEMGSLSRHAGAGLAWISQYEGKKEMKLPVAWKGEGVNPVVIFRGGDEDLNEFYFAGKGGLSTAHHHGNMDAGSFVLEMNGVRWSIDPGNQSYHPLEQAGYDMWGREQDSDRWALLTKGNHGHSTLTVNNARHKADGYAPLIDYKNGKNGENPEGVFDLSEIFEGHLQSATRRFVKEGSNTILIEDHIIPSGSTEMITWQLMTTAEVTTVSGGAILQQENEELKLEIISPENINVSIISLDPPPIEEDKLIDDLKRIEINMPAELLGGADGKIIVRLTGS